MKFQTYAMKVLGIKDYYREHNFQTDINYNHLESMHIAKMSCPGSCGSKCPNHFCNAHNGQEYNP